MSSFRFLHLADVHLDTPFYGKDEHWRGRLREAVRAAFRQGVDLAIERRAHAVLVAGDLFDNDLLTFSTEQFLITELEKLREAGIRFFYATGNHDPGRANYRAHQIAWPDNVHVFRRSQPETVPVTDASGETVGCVTGAGHVTSREERNLAESFPRNSCEVPHVAVLHTQVVSARDAANHDRYAPSAVQDLAAGMYDYWALGHIHTTQRVSPEVEAWYPGNIQGRNPRESGIKGGLWVEIEGGIVQTEFIPLSPLVWYTTEVICSPDAVTLNELVDQLVEQITAKMQAGSNGFCRELPAAFDPEYVVRVVLSGRTPLAKQLRDPSELAALGGELERLLGFPLVDVRIGSLARPLDLAALREGPGVLATAFDLIEQARSDDRFLLSLAPDVLANNVEEERRIDYLRGLLADMETALAERLLGDER